MDCDAEIARDLAELATDVALATEPQLASVGETGDSCLCDKPARSTEARCQLSGLVEKRPRIEHLEDTRIRRTERLTVGFRQECEDLAQLSATRRMDPLQQSPVSRQRQRKAIVGQFSRERAE
jgi:hypothetical protein